MTLGSFELRIKGERLDWQLSSMTQIFGQQLLILSPCIDIDDGEGPRVTYQQLAAAERRVVFDLLFRPPLNGLYAHTSRA